MSFQYLLPWGWRDSFEADFQSGDVKEGEIPARVVQVERGHFKVALDAERIIWVEVSGKLKHQSEDPESFPVVGDFVHVRLSGDRGHILRVLNRFSCLKRQAAGRAVQTQVFAANVDYVFIVTSANEDFNLRRIERYLTMVWDSGAAPVLILSKIDLCEDPAPLVAQLEKVSFQSPVISLSAQASRGLDALDPYLAAGKTSVVVGSSGVGKSTLINALIGREVAATQDIREEDGKGRHTTTARSLYRLEQGGTMIDTPGIRALQLSTSEAGIEQSFRDIEEIARDCKFTDCTHEDAPGCAIQAAIESGKLEEGRWNSYQKLLKEQRSLEIRKDPVKMREEKAKWKTIHKGLKQKLKLKRK